MSKRLDSGSDEWYQLKDDIALIYEMDEGAEREKAVKKMRKYIRETYGNDPNAKYLIDYNLKYY